VKDEGQGGKIGEGEEEEGQEGGEETQPESSE
jgi:hypothetical protein